MNRRIAAVLVALSIVAGGGVGYLVERANSGEAGAETPHDSPETSPPAGTGVTSPQPSDAAPTGSPTTDVSRLVAANRRDRADAGLPSWSPADPEDPDGKPLEVGDIVPGGIEPVMAGTQVFDYMRRGYLVADQNPPCDGNNWLWAGQLSEGLYVAATKAGTVTALGTDKDGLETGDGIGVGSSLGALRRTYGAALSGVQPDDYGVGWVHVQEGSRWLAFSLGRADQVADASRVDFVETGTGRVLHHFGDAC